MLYSRPLLVIYFKHHSGHMHKSAFERLWKTLTLPLEMSLCYLLGFVHLQQVASKVAMHTYCKMEIST